MILEQHLIQIVSFLYWKFLSNPLRWASFCCIVLILPFHKPKIVYWMGSMRKPLWIASSCEWEQKGKRMFCSFNFQQWPPTSESVFAFHGWTWFDWIWVIGFLNCIFVYAIRCCCCCRCWFECPQECELSCCFVSFRFVLFVFSILCAVCLLFAETWLMNAGIIRRAQEHTVQKGKSIIIVNVQACVWAWCSYILTTRFHVQCTAELPTGAGIYVLALDT